MSDVKQRLKSKLEATPKKRRFRGWKANLRCQTEEFSIDVPIRYQKITSSSIDEAMNVITKSKSLGVEVARKLLGEYHYGYVTEEGQEVQSEDVAYYQTIDGEEREVQQFERTKDFQITNFTDRGKMWNFLLESFYEVWSEKNGLWILANYLQEQGRLAVCSHIVLRKSFKEYYGLIFPIVIDGNYTLILILTRMNLKYEHLRPATFVAEAEPETAKPTPKSALEIQL